MRQLHPFFIIIIILLLFIACTSEVTTNPNKISEVKLQLPTIQNTSAEISSYILDDNTIAIKISNDEMYDYSGIHLYDSHSGELIRTLAQDSEMRNDLMAFSPDGTLLATAEYFYNDKIKLWRVSDGELLNTFTIDYNFQSNEVIFNKTKNIYGRVTDGPDGVKDIFFSPDGTIVGAYTKQEFQQYWDTSSGEKLNRLRRNHLDSEHDYYISINSNNPEEWKTEVRRLDDDTLISSFNTTSDNPRLSPSGQLIVSEDVDTTTLQNKTLIRNTSTGDILATLSGIFISISKDENFVVTQERNREIDTFETIVWEVTSGKKITSASSIQVENSIYVPEVLFSPDSSMATILSSKSINDKNLKLIKLSDGKILLDFNHDIFRGKVTFSDDSSKMAIGILKNQHRLNINVWNISDQMTLNTYSADGSREWSAEHICFIGENKLIAFGNKVRLWNTKDNEVLINRDNMYFSRSANPCFKNPNSQVLTVIARENAAHDFYVWRIPYGN